MDRMLRTAGRCALAFLLALGVLALLPSAVRDAVPDSVIGGAVIVLVWVLGARRVAGRSR
ncbi:MULTISPECIES: hypothetical protein [Streptomyces]|uniref:hypothetical protein n=2 Tax=Streptomyces TaxID=1883 RepID=UPI00226EA955|nr:MULTISPECIES: hypothetical protein [unclassified Streptomyces]MCY0949017.1 hypothetical protein [Streptomyces sp. H27-S2]MCZ4087461.1 hypothetical protein [Streptomyces sp. H34-S5]